MTSDRELIKNIDKIHTTTLGAQRIRRNLGLCGLDGDGVVVWCREMILRADEIVRRGKNWYVYAGDAVITVNAYSFTVITAHRAAHKK
ncbi:MAG: DUF3781 domain-containing protein [Clostridia bacterium]|nr:DUF3781 domain-containing protein [Clostridia bacterium]